MATASVSWASGESEPRLMPPVAKRFTISADRLHLVDAAPAARPGAGA